MGAYTYSGTAASNTTVDGIGASGSDSPDNIDNLIRALAASDAKFVRDLGGTGTVGGTASAITLTLNDAPSAYFDGMICSFRAASDLITPPATINVNSLGAKPLKWSYATESDLFQYCILAGHFYIIVYRSAWNTGSGAFQLINPSIVESQGIRNGGDIYTDRLELGGVSQTDTTLSRLAAGVMAVEGNAVPSPGSQAQYDMLVRGASSWDRLAIGTSGQHLVVRSGTPTWSNVSTFDTAQASTSGSAVNFTSIPSWVREIDVIFNGVSLSGTDNLLIQIGDSGGLETSGYTSSSGHAVSSPGVAINTSTAGFIINTNGAAQIVNAIIMLKKIDGNTWIASGAWGDGGRFGSMNGTKTLSATLDRLTVLPSGANSFDAGQLNICYR